MAEYTSPRGAGDVTQEMIDATIDIVEGWYNDTRVDWEDVWDRLDGSTLSDGTKLELPEDLLSPVFAKLRREVRKSQRT